MKNKTTKTTTHAATGQTPTTLEDLIPSSDVPKKYPHLYSEKSWHHCVNQRKHNGLAKAFRKVGKNLFVNTRVLAECIDSQTDT